MSDKPAVGRITFGPHRVESTDGSRPEHIKPLDSALRDDVEPGSERDSLAYWEARQEPAPYMVLLRDRNRLADKVAALKERVGELEADVKIARFAAKGMSPFSGPEF